jgi:glutamine cyclotransferase
MPTGTQRLNFNFYWGDSVVVSKYVQVTLWSDITPEKYGFKIKKTFPHDVKAYTQGLEFADGFLYEGTGQTGESTLSKFNLDKNELLHQINLPKEVFGEGITVLNDKIYQITWQSQVGFVYEKESLRKLYEFSYPTEGWGLCNNGKELIMSDGSENIYILDTEFMQEVRRLQVYDNNGPVSRLNELEYIDGIIYANIYGTDEIVAFEETTGRVIKRINLKGILDKQSVKTPIDVLNGIAWDEENERMIVTGKWWPKLFHVEFVLSKK